MAKVMLRVGNRREPDPTPSPASSASKKVALKVANKGIERESNIKGPIGYLNSYFESPTFKKRFESGNDPSLYPDALRQIKRGQSIYNPKVLERPSSIGSYSYGIEPSPTDIPIKSPTVVLDPFQAKELNMDLIQDVLPHEYSHNLRGLSPNDESVFVSKNKNPNVLEQYNYSSDVRKGKYNSFSNWLGNHGRGNSQFLHDNQPAENYSDLNALRYQMYMQGIYDTRKGPMTIEHLNKAMKDPWLNKQLTFKRLIKNFKPQDIVNLNNTVAKNSSNPSIKSKSESRA